MEGAFIVKATDFEGPLDLLLELIESHKFSINQVSLSLITDEYIQFLETVGVRDRDALSQFISVAATLMLIKSRTLLPELMLTEEEEGNIDELERRLLAYAEVRELTKNINTRFNVAPRFGTKHTPRRVPIFTPDVHVTKPSMYQTLLTLLTALPVQEILPETRVRKTIDIKDVMENLIGRIRSQMKISFARLVDGSDIVERKTSIVVHFLALLELMKLGNMDVSQEESFSDIMIESQLA